MIATEWSFRHVKVVTGPAHHYLFSIANHPGVAAGEIAFSAPQRSWAQISLDTTVSVFPHAFTTSDRIVTGITLLTDFQTKKQA